MTIIETNIKGKNNKTIEFVTKIILTNKRIFVTILITNITDNDNQQMCSMRHGNRKQKSTLIS